MSAIHLAFILCVALLRRSWVVSTWGQLATARFRRLTSELLRGFRWETCRCTAGGPLSFTIVLKDLSNSYGYVHNASALSPSRCDRCSWQNVTHIVWYTKYSRYKRTHVFTPRYSAYIDIWKSIRVSIISLPNWSLKNMPIYSFFFSLLGINGLLWTNWTWQQVLVQVVFYVSMHHLTNVQPK